MAYLAQSLSTDSLTCNKFLINKIGLHNALALEYLLKIRSDISYQLDDDGYFISQFHNVTEQTGLDRSQFQSSLNYLIDINIIKCSAFGTADQIPIIKYKINDDNYLKLFKITTKKIDRNKRFSCLFKRGDIYCIFYAYDIGRKAIKKFKVQFIRADFDIKKHSVIHIKKPCLIRFPITSDKSCENEKLENKCINFSYIIENKCLDLHKKIDHKDKLPKKLVKPKKENHYMQGIERAPRVFTTIEEHQLLLAKHGEEAVKRGYTYLANYFANKSATKRQMRAFYAMENWALEVSKNAY